MNPTLLIAVLVMSLIPPVPAATWDWPTQGPERVLREFHAPLTPWGSGHRGLDLAATGTAVLAPVAGVVSFSGPVADRGVLTLTTATGDLVSFEPVTSLVDVGAVVHKGQHIALLHPGHCATLCLHIGLRTGVEPSERYRSPRLELGILRRAVLLPWDYALG
jgi:murein DD-endopeptidase MepM/ murein hydrolase activator NlpD